MPQLYYWMIHSADHYPFVAVADGKVVRSLPESNSALDLCSLKLVREKTDGSISAIFISFRKKNVTEICETQQHIRYLFRLNLLIFLSPKSLYYVIINYICRYHKQKVLYRKSIYIFHSNITMTTIF